MCGIAGLIQTTGRPIQAEALHRACASMRHRGPDDQGILLESYPDGRLAMAAVRLAIIDPTPAGHQPMASSDGRFKLVFNGEIYNHAELREELRGGEPSLEFRSASDTEVILHLLIRLGFHGLARLRGMFALAFWDARDRRGFLARDSAGIKPLFWAEAEGAFGFASEIKTLFVLHPWPSARRPEAVLHLLRYGYIPHPWTIYQKVHHLPPGHMLTFDQHGPKTQEPFAAPRNGETQDHVTYAEACERVRLAIGRSVAQQRIADVPVGAFLSGGLDSSIVAHHLAETTPGPIKTYTIGFDEHRAYDERRYARLMAEHLGAEHEERVVSLHDVLESLPAILDHSGQPFGDSSILPTALLSRVTRERVTVALSGDGGDELFGGYWRYLGHESLQAYQRLPKWLRRGVLEPAAARLGHSRNSLYQNRVRQFRKLLRGQFQSAWERHRAWSRILSADRETCLFPDVFADSFLNSAPSDSADDLNAIFSFDIRYGLPADMLYKVDLASMMHSLEVRVPLLDEDVVAMVRSFPAEFKVLRGRRKRILHDAYRGILPDQILDRPKMGFEIPVGEWLRRELKPMFMDMVRREVVESFDLLKFDGVMGLFAEHEQRRGEHADFLFSVLALCWWATRVRGA